jgi:hypothetical protein
MVMVSLTSFTSVLIFRGRMRPTSSRTVFSSLTAAASSTRKAGTYWQRILTAGIPDGVKTRRAMQQRGAAQRDPAK